MIRDISEYVFASELDDRYVYSPTTGKYFQTLTTVRENNVVTIDEEVIYDELTQGVYKKTKYNFDLKITRDSKNITITNYGRCFLQQDAYYVITLANVDNTQETATIVIRYVDDETPTTEEEPITENFLTFTANENGSSVVFYYDGGSDTGKNMQYSIDGGITWLDYTIGGDWDFEWIPLDEGESVKFRGENENLAYFIDEWNYMAIRCAISGSVAASGDVTSLLNGVGGDVAVPQHCYGSMFENCTGLTQAPSLPATSLAEGCYEHMFAGCTGLTQAPELPATTLAENCYGDMFGGCTGLTQAPELPATTLAEKCYQYMFYGCSSLTTAPALPATTLAGYCYEAMFDDCTSLTTAPELPATTLAVGCYSGMFQNCTGLTTTPVLPATTLADGCYVAMFWGCTSLTAAPELSATTLADGCYSSMFYGCAAITSHDMSTLNTSRNVFYNNTSCASLTIHAGTPPAIANNTITGLMADCIIYVPSASVDAYKAAQYWSARASYIQAMS